MKNTISELVKSIFGGIMIGIGGTAFLASGNRYVGAVLFTCGLSVILIFGMGLFTGRAGLIVTNGSCYLPMLMLTLLGNFIGAGLIGLYASARSFDDVFTPRLSNPLWLTFLSAILCGLLVYAAVLSYRKSGSLFLTMICVPTFIISGFEHSIADIFYFVAAASYTAESVVFLGVVIIGNFIGCCLLPIYEKLTA